MDETEYFNRRIGTTLQGKWTLERLLGAGGMAAVYVGVHRIGRRDAIKILHPEVAANPEVRGRFEQEAHAVNRLRHPGAVEVRDFDVTEDGCPFLVMELLEGETLARVLERDAATLPGLLRWTDELLEVLAAAHDLGIIHRDIKPDNLFIQQDGRLKVLDFGIARMREGAPRAMVTRTGTALGTLSYMPPEQARGIHIDGRADLYSVGATLFRALGKRRIHDGASDADVLIKVATTPAPPLASVAPHVPAPVCAVVDCALAFDREHRYPHARTMQADVRALAAGQAPPYATANPPPVLLDAATPPSSTPPSGRASADERTRAEGSPARASHPIPAEPVEPAPTRVDLKAAVVPAPAPPASASVPSPPIASTPAPPMPGLASPAPAASRSSLPIVIVVGLLVSGLFVVILAGVLIALWVNSSSSPDAAAGDTSGLTPAPNAEDASDAVPSAPPRGLSTTTTPPSVTTTRTPPGSTGIAPTVTPPATTTAPPSVTIPPTATIPPGATTPPAITTPPTIALPPTATSPLTTIAPPTVTTPPTNTSKPPGHDKDKKKHGH